MGEWPHEPPPSLLSVPRRDRIVPVEAHLDCPAAGQCSIFRFSNPVQSRKLGLEVEAMFQPKTAKFALAVLALLSIGILIGRLI